MLSIPHMIVVFVVVLVVFGPQKLPELARTLGKLMAEFRKASTDFKSAFEEEMRDLERQAMVAERKKAADAALTHPANLPTIADAETPPIESNGGGGASETPGIAPAAETVPHSTAPLDEIKNEAAAVTNPHDATHDTQQPA
jgi:TatA/E family protein of Tat protein translocase